MVPLQLSNSAGVVPRVPIMPFTSYTEALPTLVELGCVQPVLKRPETMREMPERMRQAMAAPISPPPDSAWVTALQRSGDAVLSVVQHGNLHGLLVMMGRWQSTCSARRILLEKYCLAYQYTGSA